MPFAVRPHFEWKLRTRSLPLGRQTLLMGIVNVTPDSFSDGGSFLTPANALARALEMLEEGADILDLGGESTRPNAEPVSPEQEQQRVLPVLRAILRARPDCVISVDTYHAETARLAVEAGAEIVNDVSGHLWDTRMSATCAALDCGTVLMHTRGRPQEWRNLPALAADEVVPMVLGALKERTVEVMAAGVKTRSIVLDPGFGFGKAFGENFPLLADFDAFHSLGFPLLAGISRKGFLTRALREASATRGRGAGDLSVVLTAAANVAAILAGAHILRVHDVTPALEAAVIADNVLGSRQSARPDRT